MPSARDVARQVRDGMGQARFRAWAARLDMELRRRGGRLVLDAPHGLQMDAPPDIVAYPWGDGDGTFTLKIDKGARLGRGVLLEVYAKGTNVLELGERCWVQDGVRLLMRNGTIAIGEEGNIRDFSVLKTEGEMRFGFHSGMSYYCTVHCTERIIFEDMVSLAERVTVVDSIKAIDGSDTHNLAQPLKTAPIILRRNTFVGTGTVIGMGTDVGRNAIVGAQSLLTGGEYPAGHLIVGVPAKPIRQLPEFKPE